MRSKLISENETEVTFVKQEISRISSAEQCRVLIACNQQGLKVFKDFVDDYSFFTSANNIIYTDNEETIISMYLDHLQTLLVNLALDISNNSTIRKKVPKICYLIFTEDRYGYIVDGIKEYVSKYSINEIKKFIDDNTYEILGEQDMPLMNEENFLVHTHVSFRILTDNITSKYLELNIKNPMTFVNSMMRRQFIIPPEIENNKELVKIWKQICISSNEIYLNSVSTVGTNFVSREILPNCTANEIVVNASLINFVNFFNEVGKIDDLSYSINFKNLIADMSYLLDDYKHIYAVKTAIDNCIQSLNEDKLPF